MKTQHLEEKLRKESLDKLTTEAEALFRDIQSNFQGNQIPVDLNYDGKQQKVYGHHLVHDLKKAYIKYHEEDRAEKHVETFLSEVDQLKAAIEELQNRVKY